MIKRSITFMTLALALTTLCQAQSRKVINLPSWDFSRDGKAWQQVAVPHDWAISGPFDKKWDLQMVAIEQNGETEKTEKSGRSGALPWIGEGMYKMNWTAPKGYKRAVLVFDGAMSQPVVSVNGKEAGKWAYGYNAIDADNRLAMATRQASGLTATMPSASTSHLSSSLVRVISSRYILIM